MRRRKWRRNKGIKAWLLTWEHMGEHAAPDQTVAAVLSPRLSPYRVRDIAELLYANASYVPSERIEVAKSRKNTPYKAQFGEQYGASCTDQIYCGHNPWILARKVCNLRAETDDEGQEDFVWDEIAPYYNRVLAEAEARRNEDLALPQTCGEP